MPRFDGTGPNGLGPKTGRGLGNCDTTTSKESLEKEKEELTKRLEEITKELDKDK